MNGRRSNMEIVADILRLGEATKTDILYGCDISYKQLQKYLHFLIARGFLELDENEDAKKRYRTTDSGNQLLGFIDRVRILMELPDHYSLSREIEGGTDVNKGSHKASNALPEG